MADNVNLASPSGIAAADDVGGFLYQRVKPAFGADGVGTDVSATDPLPVTTSTSKTVTAAYTARPANTTQYTPLDAWNQNTSPGPITFSNMASANAGGGTITDVTAFLSTNQTQTLPAAITLLLFDGTVSLPSTTDNAAFTLSSAQLATLVAEIPITISSTGDPTVGSGNAYGVAKPCAGFNCAAGSTSLLGLVKVMNNYTPASGEVLSFKLVVQR